MLSLNGVSAWVEVDGKELEQYGVEEEPGRITCWIAAQAGKDFSIVFRDSVLYREHSLCSAVTVDGLSVGGKVLSPPSMGAENSPNYLKSRTVVQKDQVLSTTTSRHFMFSKLELTDEDEYLCRASPHLGDIQLDVFRAQRIGRQMFGAAPVSEAHGKIHERSKKVVTHCVSFGQEVKTATAYSVNVKRVDGDRQLATFIFKYRDSGLLQANGIMPKPPVPKKMAATSGEVLDLTVGEDVKPRITTQKRKALKRSSSSIECEVQPAKKIKREKFVPTGEVIDLT